MQRLARASGGASYSPTNVAECELALDQIVAELRSQYTLSFVPEAGIGGDRWHDIKVELTAQCLERRKLKKPTVRARLGYYSPKR
jgi:hypothetical protein